MATKKTKEDKFKIEKTDIVVVFNEIDHRYVSEDLFKTIVDIETENFGATLIKDVNPKEPVFQLTLPHNKITIQLIRNKLVITDDSGKTPADSNLIRQYFTSVYYPIIDTVPCSPNSFGYNFTLVLNENLDEIDTKFGIKHFATEMEKKVESYNSMFAFTENSTKFNIVINSFGKNRRVQLNAHYNNAELLNDKDDLQKMYLGNWDYFINFMTKLGKK